MIHGLNSVFKGRKAGSVGNRIEDFEFPRAFSNVRARRIAVAFSALSRGWRQLVGGISFSGSETRGSRI